MPALWSWPNVWEKLNPFHTFQTLVPFYQTEDIDGSTLYADIALGVVDGVARDAMPPFCNKFYFIRLLCNQSVIKFACKNIVLGPCLVAKNFAKWVLYHFRLYLINIVQS